MTTQPTTRPNKLIVFARYPQPGKAKTRLIPALGPEGAAALQHEMTRFTLARLAPLRARGTAVEIRYAGGNESAMRTLYGPNWSYRPQASGDLGLRLAEAAKQAFDEGHPLVALIGADCPDLDSLSVERAYAMLAANDLVLGPAADGGYYLIALRRLIPEIFEGIPWSTPEVLDVTRRVAGHSGLGLAMLPQLQDVDVPEDLPVWRRARGLAPER